MRGWTGTGTYAVAAAVGAGVAVAARVVAVHVIAVDLAQFPSLHVGSAPRLKQAAMIGFRTYNYVVLEEAAGVTSGEAPGRKSIRRIRTPQPYLVPSLQIRRERERGQTAAEGRNQAYVSRQHMLGAQQWVMATLKPAGP